MDFVDTRRLTGVNLHDDSPGAVARVRLAPDEDASAAVLRWREALAEGAQALGLSLRTHARIEVDAKGVQHVDLMLVAPIDSLYAAADLAQWAVARAEGKGADLAPVLRDAAEERDLRRGAVSLADAADARGLPWLVDDEHMSLGYGHRSRTWPLADLPAPSEVSWDVLASIPVAVVTGTNGKTTTTRLLARIVRLAGKCVGNSSTDGLCINERLVEAGDWTGTGAARILLRHQDVNVAVLEAARGGLLRRGLQVGSVDVAVITNVERDHLGEWGVFDVAAMAEAKGIVTRVVRPGGCIVLGADSAALVGWARSRHFPAAVQWFSPDPEHPVLVQHRADGGAVWTVNAAGMLVRRDHDGEHALVPVADIPLTVGARARHNVSNALSAAAAATAMGIAEGPIREGLLEFGRDPSDNPGRTHTWKLPSGPTILFDFAHNLAGLSAVGDFVRALARSTIVAFGMPGDRSDDDLRAIGAALVALSPRAIILRDLPSYLRGRLPGTVPALLEQGALAAGFSRERVHHVSDECAALGLASTLANPDDLILNLLHTERDDVARWLADAGAQASPLGSRASA